jgi:hypothetical protein
MLGVLPGAGETAVVEENVAFGKDAGLAVLFVLLNGVAGFGGGDFELTAGVLGAGGREGGREGELERHIHTHEEEKESNTTALSSIPFLFSNSSLNRIAILKEANTTYISQMKLSAPVGRASSSTANRGSSCQREIRSSLWSREWTR